jgi:4-diphosphocytidyl-2-C-methyl-D-erythritol kinase
MITVAAPAKLNLVLEVLGDRPDGFHEISSLIQTISLYDILSFEPADDISLECTEPALQTDANLVLKAAQLLKKTSNCKYGAKISLKKQIPLSSGLGGGSSDAAATLTGLNDLWKLGLKTHDLLALAGKLGSDVPFFIYKDTALISGRGEKVTPLLPPLSQSWFVLLMPALPTIADKTRQAYSRLNSQHYTRGQSTSKAMEDWRKNKQLSPARLFNAFDSVCFDMFPGLEQYWSKFKLAGASHIHLAGAGPTLFASVASNKDGEELCQRLTEKGLIALVVSSSGPSALHPPFS